MQKTFLGNWTCPLAHCYLPLDAEWRGTLIAKGPKWLEPRACHFQVFWGIGLVFCFFPPNTEEGFTLKIYKKGRWDGSVDRSICSASLVSWVWSPEPMQRWKQRAISTCILCIHAQPPLCLCVCAHVAVRPVVPAFRRLRQEDQKFLGSLGFIVRNLSQQNKIKNEWAKEMLNLIRIYRNTN